MKNRGRRRGRSSVPLDAAHPRQSQGQRNCGQGRSTERRSRRRENHADGHSDERCVCSPIPDAQTAVYHTRHMLAELTPKPEQVTIGIGTTQMDIAQMFTDDDVKGTALENSKMAGAWVGL